MFTQLIISFWRLAFEMSSFNRQYSWASASFSRKHENLQLHHSQVYYAQYNDNISVNVWKSYTQVLLARCFSKSQMTWIWPFKIIGRTSSTTYIESIWLTKLGIMSLTTSWNQHGGNFRQRNIQVWWRDSRSCLNYFHWQELCQLLSLF